MSSPLSLLAILISEFGYTNQINNMVLPIYYKQPMIAVNKLIKRSLPADVTNHRTPRVPHGTEIGHLTPLHRLDSRMINQLEQQQLI